ncbi:MAG TPA: methyl-accepting chemotaxis protein [Bdellovibrionota bacterium]|nr:methyl-accepting chemotaxis protein [Bdellovibrionota bacterium]
MSYKSWSLKTKIMSFGIGVTIGAVVILGIYGITMKTFFDLQTEARQDGEISRILGEIEGDVADMGNAIVHYMSTSKEAEWAEKIKADETAAHHFAELKKVPMSPELSARVQELSGFDEKVFAPLDDKLKASILAKKSKEELLAWYAEHYVPAMEQFNKALTDIQTETEKELEGTYSRQKEKSINGALTIAATLVLMILLSLVAAFIIGGAIARPLENVISNLRRESSEANDSSQNIASASHQLAQSATEQASALQETASSIEEMSAMITKNADNAAKSGTAARNSSEVAHKGKQASEQMIQAINDINLSNASIMKQIEESNQQISDITKVIAEIGNKTKVINDIVFQTKLLSFNASVEAARAGEHGKGFAVVAEEVGNLAQMSGNAAKEIAEMLEGSIRKVEDIVTQTKTKVEHLVSEGRKKVEAGTVIAQKTGKVLEEIVSEVNEVSTMVNEITTATREQAQGIAEINKAMNQMDQVTNQNSSASQQIAAAAESLNSQSQTMANVVGSLEVLVWGEHGTHAQTTSIRAPETTGHSERKQSEPKQGKHDTFTVKAKKVPSEPAVAAPAPEANVPSENDPGFKEV